MSNWTVAQVQSTTQHGKDPESILSTGMIKIKTMFPAIAR